jgi:hypothetical protein
MTPSRGAPDVLVVTSQPGDAGWARFVESYHQQRPVKIRADGSVFSEQTVFDAVISACDAIRANVARRGDLKLYLGGRQALDSEFPRLLPQRSDRSLRGYERRLSADREVDTRTFTLYISGLQFETVEILDEAIKLLWPIVELGGMWPGVTELELFLGRYGFTPGGIHLEGCSNLHTVVHGEKTMWVWPREEWEVRPVGAERQLDLPTGSEEVFLPQVDPMRATETATRLTGRRGDSLYWPAGRWHIGEAPSFAVAVNAAMYMGGPVGDRHEWAAQPVGLVDGWVVQDPALRKEAEALARDDAVELAGRWLARLSSCGLIEDSGSPAVASDAEASNGRLRLRTKLPSGEAVSACRGAWTVDKQLSDLVARA